MSKAAVEVAPAKGGDKSDWVALWTNWQRHMSGAVPAKVTEKTWALALDPESRLRILIARINNRAVGFATVSLTPFAWTGSNIAFLQDLFIAEEARGQGAGEALLEGVYRLADDLGAAQVFWMVDEKDAGLQRFYGRNAIRTPYLRYMRRPWPW